MQQPSGVTDPPPRAVGHGILDTRVGKPGAFSGEESTWSDWSFNLRACVLVIEPTLGTTIEETELEAHADGGNPASLSAQRWTHSPDLLVMLTTGPALQILRQPSGVQAFRYLT